MSTKNVEILLESQNFKEPPSKKKKAYGEKNRNY